MQRSALRSHQQKQHTFSGSSARVTKALILARGKCSLADSALLAMLRPSSRNGMQLASSLSIKSRTGRACVLLPARNLPLPRCYGFKQRHCPCCANDLARQHDTAAH